MKLWSVVGLFGLVKSFEFENETIYHGRPCLHITTKTCQASPPSSNDDKRRIAKTRQNCLDCTFHLFRLYVITALYIKFMLSSCSICYVVVFDVIEGD